MGNAEYMGADGLFSWSSLPRLGVGCASRASLFFRLLWGHCCCSFGKQMQRQKQPFTNQLKFHDKWTPSTLRPHKSEPIMLGYASICTLNTSSLNRPTGSLTYW